MLPSNELITALNDVEAASLHALLSRAYAYSCNVICADHDMATFVASQWPASFGYILLLRGDPQIHRDTQHCKKYLTLAVRELAVLNAIARFGIDGLLVEPDPNNRWRRVERCIRYCERAERLYLAQAGPHSREAALQDMAGIYRYTRTVLLGLGSRSLPMLSHRPIT